MTDDEIIGLAQAYLEEWWDRGEGHGRLEYTGDVRQIVQFARIIYEQGCEDGWQDRKVCESK